MCNKRQICCKCNRERVNEYGDIRLCQCDLDEIYRATSKIKNVKVSEKGYFSGFFTKPDEKLVKAILKDFKKLMKSE